MIQRKIITADEAEANGYQRITNTTRWLAIVDEGNTVCIRRTKKEAIAAARDTVQEYLDDDYGEPEWHLAKVTVGVHSDHAYEQLTEFMLELQPFGETPAPYGWSLVLLDGELPGFVPEDLKYMYLRNLHAALHS